MSKSQAELLSQTAKADAMMRMIDSLRRQSDTETAKLLDKIVIAGLDAYHATKSGL